jgi:sulfite oxidase
MQDSNDAPSDSTRRRFLSRSALLAITSAIGAHIPFGRFFPLGLTPVALAAETPDLKAFGKHPDLVILGDKPFVAETPAHLLDDEITPIDRLFIRHNGVPPDIATIDPQTWALKIEGESANNPIQFSIAELKSKFKNHTQHIALECAGNGRSGFYPPAKGNQWTTGGVGFPEWTGVLLRDVLKHAGVKDDAVYVAYYGADTHLSGDASKVVISRGVPIAKAMQTDSLIVWGINGQDLPLHHGYPLRLVIAGYPGSASGKWLQRLAIRNKVHDGPGMSGHSYRVACQPIAPGEDFKDYCIIEAMPVKSLITSPRSGIEHAYGQALPIRGHAWTGQKKITAVHISLDFGQTWLPTKLKSARNASGPQRFTTELAFPSKGYYEVWARATDDSGKMQPMVTPGWNAGGYANNAMHRVAVKVI